MKHVIWKFNLGLGDGIAHPMPKGARIVHFAMQDGKPMFWARCDPEQPREVRTFIIVGTGHPFWDNWKHLGTCQDGRFVWHLMEVPLGDSHEH